MVQRARTGAASIGLLLPLGGACSPVRFFCPLHAFFAAMCAYRHATIVDVGAGQGHVTDALIAHGFDAVGIDVRTDGASSSVQLANALAFDYPAGSVGLFCRPCHSALFVEPTIDRMVACDVSAIVYVGKWKSAGSDLGRHRKKFKLAGVVGVERERLYVWNIRR
jgi:hypothetical protein